MLERVCMRSDGVRNDSQRIHGRALCLMEKRLGLIARGAFVGGPDDGGTTVRCRTDR